MRHLGQDDEGKAWFRHRPSYGRSYLLRSKRGLCGCNLCKCVLL